MLVHLFKILKLSFCISHSKRRGGDYMRSGCMRYVPVIQADVPAHTTCRHDLYNSFFVGWINLVWSPLVRRHLFIKSAQSISYHLSTKLEGIAPRGYSPQDLVLKSIGLKTNQLSIQLIICTFKNYLAK